DLSRLVFSDRGGRLRLPLRDPGGALCLLRDELERCARCRHYHRANPGHRRDCRALLLDPDHQRGAASHYRRADRAQSAALGLPHGSECHPPDRGVLSRSDLGDHRAHATVHAAGQGPWHRPDLLRDRHDGEYRDRHVHAAVRVEHLCRTLSARRTARHHLSRCASIRRRADRRALDHYLLARTFAVSRHRALKLQETPMPINRLLQATVAALVVTVLASTRPVAAQTVMKLANATI